MERPGAAADELAVCAVTCVAEASKVTPSICQPEHMQYESLHLCCTLSYPTFHQNIQLNALYFPAHTHALDDQGMPWQCSPRLVLALPLVQVRQQARLTRSEMSAPGPPLALWPRYYQSPCCQRQRLLLAPEPLLCSTLTIVSLSCYKSQAESGYIPASFERRHTCKHRWNEEVAGRRQSNHARAVQAGWES